MDTETKEVQDDEELFSTENSQTTTFSKGFIDDLGLSAPLKDQLQSKKKHDINASSHGN